MKTKLTAVCLGALLLGAYGCGGDGKGGVTPEEGSGGSGGMNDIGTTGGTGGDTGAEATIDFDVSRDVPGFPSSVTASVSDASATGHQWSLTKQPEGSELDADDLEGADAETVSFVPQVSGTYELTLEVTTVDGVLTESTEVAIEGYDIPFVRLSIEKQEEGMVLRQVAMMADSGAAGAREVGCPYTMADPPDLSIGGTLQDLNTAVYLPKDAADSARIVSRVHSDVEDVFGQMEFAHSGSSCDEAPPVLRDEGAQSEDYGVPFAFSPDGERIVGLVRIDGSDQIVSFPFGEGESHSLFAGGLNRPPTFSWFGNAGVVVVGESDDDVHFATFLPDTNDALNHEDAFIMAHCTGVTPDVQILNTAELAVTEDFILIQRAGNMVRMTRDELDAFSCESEADSNLLINQDLKGGDFDVSADGAWVTFWDGMAGIYVIPSEGSDASLRLSPEDDRIHMAPSFTLGGRQVVWISYQMDGDIPENVRLHRANRDGSSHYVVAELATADGYTLLTMGRPSL